MADTVFVSSTCYDLIDVRAELEAELRDLGLTPVMSDRPSAEFAVTPDANSIESCLANVRRCDAVVVILSQRYGPSLKKAGYPDVSATHLEYLAAREANKPIHMYVRDRLEADFGLWKRNAERAINLSWVKAGDEAIFGLLDDHRRLVADAKRSNWFWVFRDSRELRSRIGSDFQKQAGRAVLRRLMDTGRVPALIPQVERWSIDKKTRILSLDVSVTNAGTAPALQPFAALYSDAGEDVMQTRTLLPGQSVALTYSPKLSVRSVRAGNPLMWFEFSYATLEGHYIGDEFELELSWEPRQSTGWFGVTYACKRYYHSGGIVVKARDEA